jgi:hypothetical protein
MNRFAVIVVGVMLCIRPASATVEEHLDRLEEALTWSTPTDAGRARLSGFLDAEGYVLPKPVPGVIDAEGQWLFNPRLTTFLDFHWRDSVYGFVQARIDRGFDPSDDGLRTRVDEYAIRWTPDPRRTFHVQVGRFATVVGNWTTRHDSWSNPFITAPLPYENLTGIWDNEPPKSAQQLLVWSHVRPGIQSPVSEFEKYLRLPIVWGPSYATGVAVAGAIDNVKYAFEVKNASLSSRPDAWSPRESYGDHPTVSGRVRYVPDERWEFGWSASTGSFLRPVAETALPPGVGRGSYRQTVVAHDVTYAWHHLQIWAEVYLCRFQVAPAGNADTAAYYVEARQKFTPRFSGAVRWNQQLYGRINDVGTRVKWGRELWRIDVAPAVRFTSHVQAKLQYSVQPGEPDASHLIHLVAGQLTVRF